MAGSEITASSIADQIGNTNFPGKSNRLIWYNSYQGRFDGLIPKDEGGSNEDHYIYKDIGGTETITSVELEDRGTGHPTIFWDDAGKTLHCLSAHNVTFEFWSIDYNSTTDTYSFITDKGAAGLGVTVTTFGRTNAAPERDQGIGLVKTPNGHLWAFQNQESNELRVTKSTDNGETWATPVLLVDPTTDHGCTDAFWFANGGTNYVCVYSTDNGGNTSVGYFHYIAETELVSGTWTDESSSLPAYDTNQEGDDHCCIAKDSSENIFIVYKCEGTNLSTVEVIKRTPSGTWSGPFEVWADSDNRTRPVIAVKKKDSSTDEEIIVACSLTGGTTATVKYKTSDVGTVSFGSEVTLFEDTVGSDNFEDSFAPCKNHIYDSTSGIMFLAKNVTDNKLWQNELTITAPAITGTGALNSQAATTTGTGTVTGTEVTGTGALSSQAATLAGTGEVEKTASGALSSQAAAVAGTGLIEKTGTGALNADAATTTGAGLIEKTGTGALSSDAATIAGTGAVGSVVTGTGALNADAATVAGAGLIEKTGTGALNADAATTTGAGLIEKTASGALNADAATVAGTGQVGVVVTGTGALATQSATMTGAGLIEKTASGTLAADAATMTGAGVMARSGTGAVAAGPATMAGVAIVERTASGVLSAQAATMAGTGNVSDVAQNYETIAFSLMISRSKSFNLGISRSWP